MADLRLYYEGGTVDRWWIAPVGLLLDEAKRKRVSKLYKTEWMARQRLLVIRDLEASKLSEGL